MPAVANATATQSTGLSSENVFSSMGGDEFLKLLVAQMRYQNPMAPSDPTAMMGQIATYAQVEALNKIQAGQASDSMMNAARMATEMVGKTVTATDGVTTETGKVTAARFTADGPVLVLDTGIELGLGSVISITDAPTTPATTGTTTTTGTPTGTTTDTTGTGTTGTGTTGTGTDTTGTTVTDPTATGGTVTDPTATGGDTGSAPLPTAPRPSWASPLGV